MQISNLTRDNFVSKTHKPVLGLVDMSEIFNFIFNKDVKILFIIVFFSFFKIYAIVKMSGG